MANYYDEYRNDLYNPDDGHDTKKPGRNANWKAIQKGFKDTQSEIDRLDGRVDELEERVETAEEHVANLEERVTAEEAINREQQVQIDANTAKNAEQDTRLDGIDDAIERIDAKDAEQDGRLDAIEEEQDEQDILIREHGNRLTAHDASIADINTRISQINAKDNEQDDAIEDLQDRMTAVEAEQEVERQEHAEIKLDIQQIQLDIGTHDRLIAQNAQNIANNTQAIQDEATNRLNADTDLRARIDANAQAIADEADARETADQRIEDKVDAVREEFDACCEEVKADIDRIDAKDAEQDALLTDHGRRLTADEQMLADHGDRITALEGRTTQNEADITALQTELNAKSAALDAGLTPIASVKDGTTVNQVTDDAFTAMQNEEVDVYGNVEGVLRKVEYVVTDANTITVTGVGVITKSGSEYSISWDNGVSNADISLCEKGLIASDEKVEAVAQELSDDIADVATRVGTLEQTIAGEAPTTRDSQTVTNTRDTTIGDSSSNFNVEVTKDANGESMTITDTANGDSVSVGFTSDANGDSIIVGGNSYKLGEKGLKPTQTAKLSDYAIGLEVQEIAANSKLLLNFVLTSSVNVSLIPGAHYTLVFYPYLTGQYANYENIVVSPVITTESAAIKADANGKIPSGTSIGGRYYLHNLGSSPVTVTTGVRVVPVLSYLEGN